MKQASLFRGGRKYLSSGATFSPCGLYRYRLHRELAIGTRVVLFVGLNPSTATETQDDPTIRRCIGYARAWGFEWFRMGNVCAYRSTDPKGLTTVDDPVGPGNRAALREMADEAELVIAAWGGERLCPAAQAIAKEILGWKKTKCLGQNRDGTPKHPLYLKKTVMPVAIARTKR